MNDHQFLRRIDPYEGRAVAKVTPQADRLRREGLIVEEIGETSHTLHLTRKGLVQRA